MDGGVVGEGGGPICLAAGEPKVQGLIKRLRPKNSDISGSKLFPKVKNQENGIKM